MKFAQFFFSKLSYCSIINSSLPSTSFTSIWVITINHQTFQTYVSLVLPTLGFLPLPCSVTNPSWWLKLHWQVLLIHHNFALGYYVLSHKIPIKISLSTKGSPTNFCPQPNLQVPAYTLVEIKWSSHRRSYFSGHWWREWNLSPHWKQRPLDSLSVGSRKEWYFKPFHCSEFRLCRLPSQEWQLSLVDSNLGTFPHSSPSFHSSPTHSFPSPRRHPLHATLPLHLLISSFAFMFVGWMSEFTCERWNTPNIVPKERALLEMTVVQR